VITFGSVGLRRKEEKKSFEIQQQQQVIPFSKVFGVSFMISFVSFDFVFSV